MARLLAYTSPARGHLYPIVDTLLELQRRGHEIHVRTLSSEVGTLASLGFDASPVDAAIEHTPLDTWRAASPDEGLALALRTFARRAEHEVPDVRRALEEVGPDAMIVDITTVGAAAVAEAEGLPWVRSIPLFQHFLIDPRAPRSSLMVPFGLAPEGIDVVDTSRRRVGLDALDDATDLWRADAEIYFTAPPFEDDTLDFPDTFRLVGPGLWTPDVPAPQWLRSGDRPLVLVSVSSEFQRDDVLIQVTLDALADEDLDVMVGTGAHDPSRFRAPANARITDWLPHREAVEQADLVVCHGGMGITQRALAAGVPVCVVPFGRDQFEVAARVVATDVGTVVYPDALDAAAVNKAVRDALEKRDAAAAVATGFRRAGGAAAAAGAVEQLLIGRPAGTGGATKSIAYALAHGTDDPPG